jgi:hypothetical protein
MKILLIGLALLSSGCVASNLADVVRAMGESDATVCVSINTIYGTGKLYRSNIKNGTVKCDMDGMAVKPSE